MYRIKVGKAQMLMSNLCTIFFNIAITTSVLRLCLPTLPWRRILRGIL
jgi:hypothetical protein